MIYSPSSNPFSEGSKQFYGQNSLTNESAPFLQSESNFKIQIPAPISYIPTSNPFIKRRNQFQNPKSLTNELSPFSNPFIAGSKQFPCPKNYPSPQNKNVTVPPGGLGYLEDSLDLLLKVPNGKQICGCCTAIFLGPQFHAKTPLQCKTRLINTNNVMQYCCINPKKRHMATKILHSPPSPSPTSRKGRRQFQNPVNYASLILGE
jgi:hypothetical protein